MNKKYVNLLTYNYNNHGCDILTNTEIYTDYANSESILKIWGHISKYIMLDDII